MITEDYVSFEIAKLLKEKGFDEKVDTLYKMDAEFLKSTLCINYNDTKFTLSDMHNIPENTVSAPTLQMAMKWLREVYNVAVSVYVFNRDLPIKENGIRYTCDIATTKISSKEGHLRLTGTYEQVCEAAIKYCLENLI